LLLQPRLVEHGPPNWTKPSYGRLVECSTAASGVWVVCRGCYLNWYCNLDCYRDPGTCSRDLAAGSELHDVRTKTGLHNDDERSDVDSSTAKVHSLAQSVSGLRIARPHLQAALVGLAQSCYSGYFLHRHCLDYSITTRCILIILRA
jgi:hypothetical protein